MPGGGAPRRGHVSGPPRRRRGPTTGRGRHRHGGTRGGAPGAGQRGTRRHDRTRRHTRTRRRDRTRRGTPGRGRHDRARGRRAGTRCTPVARADRSGGAEAGPSVAGTVWAGTRSKVAKPCASCSPPAVARCARSGSPRISTRLRTSTTSSGWRPVERVRLVLVPRTKLDRAARTDAPQGVLAHARPLEEVELDTLCRARRGVAPFLLVLDGVTDPHNVGALLRTRGVRRGHRRGAAAPSRRPRDADGRQGGGGCRRASRHRRGSRRPQRAAAAGRARRDERRPRRRAPRRRCSTWTSTPAGRWRSSWGPRAGAWRRSPAGAARLWARFPSSGP